ncbi:unnamed protein product [Miscanthus lutarioriparius]|uniref:Uncharacterized protein n=1 Tax=Miscanthus lutarioriparius TaxID=422564 RepID=A0A811RGT8_9POAL|nr:unnamed protein product [Miscanthus lutarioriparius]
MAAALLQALLAVAGAPSPSRSGRATIARRRSVSGIRRPACGLHSRARHGAGTSSSALTHLARLMRKMKGEKDAKDEEVVIPSHLLGPGNMDLEEGQVEDMDLADDDVVVGKDQLLDASIQPEISVAAVQTVTGFEVKLDKGDGTENAPIYESNSISVQESRILLNGILCISANILLQLQVPMFSEDLFVSIESWELESKRKLTQLMQQWSEWQARRQHHLKITLAFGLRHYKCFQII